MTIGRYHSWVVDPNSPAILEARLLDKDGEAMSLRHRILAEKGVQFHSESFLTNDGKAMLQNWNKAEFY